MIIELFITIEIIAIIFGIFAFKTMNPVLWALFSIFTAILAVGAWNMEYRSNVVENATVSFNPVLNTSHVQYDYKDIVTTKPDAVMGSINIGLFCISLVYFFITVFEEVERHRNGEA